MAARSSTPSCSTEAHFIRSSCANVCRDRSLDGKMASSLESLRTWSRAWRSHEEPHISEVSFIAVPSASRLALPGQSIWKSTNATQERKQRPLRHSFVFFRAAPHRKKNSKHLKTVSNSG